MIDQGDDAKKDEVMDFPTKLQVSYKKIKQMNQELYC